MKIAAAAGLAIALTLPTAAHALTSLGPCMNYLHYDFTLSDPSLGGIRNGVATNTYVNGSGITWPVGSPVDGSGHGVVEDYFPKDFCGNPPLQGFVMGILGDPWSGDLEWNPGHPSGTYHVVMLMSHDAAIHVPGREFQDLFLTSEDELLNNLYYGTTVACSESSPDQRGCQGIDYAWAFADRLRTGPNNIGGNTEDPCGPNLDGTPGCPIYDTRDAWFNIPGPGALPTGYDVVSFSTGAIIGTGSVTLTPAATVPEPSTWALLFTGLAGVGAAARRRARRGHGIARQAEAL